MPMPSTRSPPTPRSRALAVARDARGLPTILTPHPLEAARLLGSTSAAVQADRIGAAREIAARYRAVVVLKGSGTVIAAPGAVPRINATGNAALASAGTGDVLAGWIGGRWASTGATPRSRSRRSGRSSMAQRPSRCAPGPCAPPT